MQPLVSIDEIRTAAAALAGVSVRTPLVPFPRAEPPLLVKPESLQPVGAFKLRGAYAAMSTLPAAARQIGVVTHSSGNHGQAVAYAAALLGMPAVVVVPDNAPAVKVAAIRELGAEIVVSAPGLAARLAATREIATQRGAVSIPPFDDRRVIAGQGTVGLEIIDGCTAPDLVVVPVGGGGLISGVATAVKLRSPGTRVVGVEPLGANAMSHALRQDAPERLPSRPNTIADGLSAPFAGRHTLAHVKAYVDEVVEIAEAPIVEAWWQLMDATKLLLEPAAVVGLAAIRAGALTVTPGSTVVLVLSGSNTSPEILQRLADPRV